MPGSGSPDSANVTSDWPCVQPSCFLDEGSVGTPSDHKQPLADQILPSGGLETSR